MKSKVYEYKERDEISNANIILQIILYALFSVPEQQRLTFDINPKSKKMVTINTSYHPGRIYPVVSIVRM
jgi:hypothetical protein